MRRIRMLLLLIMIAVLVSLDVGAVFAVSNPVRLSDHEVKMDRVFNFRDMGGYRTSSGKRVRSGVLYRSGELTYASDTDIRRMSEQMGIRKILDLRYVADRKYCPDRKVPGAVFVHIPIKQERKLADQKAIKRNARFTTLGKSAESARFYGTFAGSRRKVVRKNTTNLVNSKASRKAYRAYFRHLLKNRQGDPLLVHCIAGKDRTGIASCMTLIALGVDEKTAIRDYCLTNNVYTKYGAGTYGKYSRGVSEADLRYALRKMKKKYGSYRKFFRKAYGLNDKDLKQLKAIYLE